MDDIEKMALQAVKQEKQLAEEEAKYAAQNKKFAAFLKKQTETQQQIAKMWATVKEALVAAKHYDVIDNENFRISISSVFAFEADVEKLPPEYTETIKVAKKDKIKKHFELYDELPTGVTDKSYYRLNKKVK